AGAVPLIGHWTLRFLRGGERVTGGTLSRFYAWHVAVLPAITFLLLVFHLVQVQFHGMSVPDSVEKEEKAGAKRREMPFVPHFALREAFGWTIALGVLGALAALFPWELGDKADPFAPAYADIRPEWYFMFMFETLKLVPGGAIFGIEYEAIAIMAFGALGGLLLIVPFLDARLEKSGKAWILTLLGALILAYAAGMTAYGYRSWLPLAGAAAPALIAWAVGKLSGGRPS
ncbi:MAG TPA: cytochrome b N-terminal domain-containing protein, partial [bacterium]|nr:cytochrome b N-terminal domain-containing protein [bacterium]